ncbi:MAG: hypothetical protein AMXMBFR84_28890 [Candidatus Hydrogenedentota bacterium]
MPNVVAIANGHVALKLGLTGIFVEHASDVHQAQESLVKNLEGDADVLVIQDEFRDQFSEWHKEQLRRHRGTPLVVFCPSFSEENSNVDAYISAVLKPAIGYEIRLD